MRTYVGVVAALLAIAAIGCGSGGDTTQAELTRAQFIKRADAICSAAQAKQKKEINAWRREAAKEGKPLVERSPEELGQVYRSVALPPIEAAAEELTELVSQTGDPNAEEYVDSLRAAVEEIQEKPATAIRKTPYMSADRLGQKYGFNYCGLF